MPIRVISMLLLAAMSSRVLPSSAQSLIQRADSTLAARYYRLGNIDTTYIMRPQTKWTITARMNVSGAKMESEGIKNPAKLMGRYRDYELNFNSYGRRFGFDVIYQDAHNFTGWHDHEGMDRIELPEGMLKVKTLNLNAFYVFNSRRFSYPAAFSQSYIQRRSAGSFLGSIGDGSACHPRLGTGDAIEDDEHRAWGRLWLQLRAR